MKFYGQQGEDKILYEVFKNKETGFFIDVGAYDGIKFSNSFVFEQLGWKGICIEPNKESFKQLKINRPNSLCIRAQVSYELNQESFFVENEMLSHKFRDEDGTDNMTYVGMLPLNFLVSILGIDSIDFISIDTEGFDYDVLCGYDFKLKPKIVIVETDSEEIDSLMKAEGYIKAKRHYFNTFFCLTQELSDAVNSIDPRMENGQDV